MENFLLIQWNELLIQGRIQEIQKEGARTVSAKTLMLACGKSMKVRILLKTSLK
jgi:hypothetical protein